MQRNTPVCMSKDELLSMKDVFEYGNHTNLLHTRRGMKSALQTEDKDTVLADLSKCESFVTAKRYLHIHLASMIKKT